MEKVERNFAYLNSQTSELWLGVRDGDLALLGISMGGRWDWGVSPSVLSTLWNHPGELELAPVQLLDEKVLWEHPRAWDRAGTMPKHPAKLC